MKEILIIGRGIPVAAAITYRRDMETYAAILQHLQAATHNAWKPEAAIVDFELAEIQAIQKQFPDCHVHGCYFHWKQAILRWLRSKILHI
jgi:hypothetical protein